MHILHHQHQGLLLRRVHDQVPQERKGADLPRLWTELVQHRLHASGLTAEEDVALLLQLLDLPVAPEGLPQLSPQARQARTFALLRHLVLHAAQQQLLVLA